MYIVWLCCFSDEVVRIRHQLSGDRDRLLISDFCEPRPYSPAEAMSATKYNPRVTWFNLSAAAGTMLVLLYEWKDSDVFRQIWKAQLKRVATSGNKLTVDQIEQSIWQQAKGIWEAFSREMVSKLVIFIYPTYIVTIFFCTAHALHS